MILASLFAAVVLMAASGPVDDPTPRVVAAQGALVGRSAEGVDSFKAIPYAAPPVGPLRWRPPQPAAGWTGERDAGQVGAICIQPPANGDNGVGPLPMSEDCLTLNIWTPEGRSEPLPVMVWIHGGGFNNGSGTAALYDGTNLAKRGVVVVTLNYRVGRLGFFDHPTLAAERGQAPGANYGLMDMIAALQWVRDNIGAFGGDPGQVTIFGESSGGSAVTRLMITPQARGLFQRAVVQSGLGRDQGTPLDTPPAGGGLSLQDRGAAFARARGFDTPTAAQLRAIPAEDLLNPPPSFYGGDLLVRDSHRNPAMGMIARPVVSAETANAESFSGSDGKPLWLGRKAIFDWSSLMRAEAALDNQGRPAVVVRLDRDGARDLAQYTSGHVGGAMAILIDGRVVVTPVIQAPILEGSLILGGDYSVTAATELIDALNQSADSGPGMIAEDVEAAFAAGREAPVPLIIGSNSAEFWWIKPSELSPYGALDDAMTPDERAAFLAAYGGQDGYDAAVLTDLVFAEPARHLARLHARNGHPSWLYRFDVVSAAMPEPHAGATHASERQYVFDNLAASPWATTERDQRAADIMAGYWTTFAKTGDPNGAGRPVWPGMTADGDRLLEFGNDGPAAKAVPNGDRLDLVEAYYARIR